MHKTMVRVGRGGAGKTKGEGREAEGWQWPRMSERRRVRQWRLYGGEKLSIMLECLESGVAVKPRV